MKHILLTMAAAAMVGSAFAQSNVRRVYTETASLQVEQVVNTESEVQLNRYLMAGYNTLCLPTALSTRQLEAAGLRVERMAGIGVEGSTLCLYFTDCTAQGTEAGVPYLVFSPKAQYLRVVNTESDGMSADVKTIRMTDAEGNQVSFGSSWQQRTREGMYGIPAKQNTAVLESVLIKTSGDQSFLPTRCGFCWEQQSSTAESIEIRHISESDVTAISAVAATADSGAATFNVGGQRLSSKAQQRGIVIRGGKKQVVR